MKYHDNHIKKINGIFIFSRLNLPEKGKLVEKKIIRDNHNETSSTHKLLVSWPYKRFYN